MTRAELLALAQRVETEEPSRELVGEVAHAFGWQNVRLTPSYTGYDYVGDAPDGSSCGCWIPNWLHSLDAAASLMPPGWRVVEMRQRLDGFWVCVFQNQYRTEIVTGKAPTEPEARTAAALRAIAQEAKDE